MLKKYAASDYNVNLFFQFSAQGSHQERPQEDHHEAELLDNIRQYDDEQDTILRVDIEQRIQLRKILLGEKISV